MKNITPFVLVAHGVLIATLLMRFGAVTAIGIYAASYEVKNVIRRFKFVRF